MNLSVVSNKSTARTRSVVARRRAENLAILGVEKVIELCVGPSMDILRDAYAEYGIELYGNDIEPRWKKYSSSNKWIIGDALKISLSEFDAAVFAPPLSKGCTGKRKDALSIEDITPSYYSFLKKNDLPKITILVLPGKTFSIAKDRKQLFKLINTINCYVEIIKMKDEKDKVNKYIELYLIKGYYE